MLYPQGKHRRRENPPPQGTYDGFRPYVRREFFRRCVYCCMPDGLRGSSYFAVEHYLPKVPFDNLALTYSNLYYACQNCNCRKGQFWPKDADLAAGRFIANPCDHVMTEHVKFDRDRVVARSKAGEFMLERLALNLKEIVEHRAFILSSIRDNLRLRTEAQTALIGLDERLAVEADPEQRLEMESARRELSENVDTAESNLRLVLSTDSLPDE